MLSFRGISRISSIALVTLALAACSASSRVVRTYDGDKLDASRVATLLKPAEIEIESVDGKDMKTYLMNNLEMNYELLPGAHTVVFHYSKLWSIPGKKDIGEKNAEQIQSDAKMVQFSAVAGRTYTFQMPAPQSRDEAVSIAANFKTELTDENGRVIARSVSYVAAQPQSTAVAAPITAPVVAGAAGAAVAGSAAVAPTTSTPAVAPSSAAVAVTPAPATPVNSAVSNLDALKILWQSTSSEDKKEFLRWAFK